MGFDLRAIAGARRNAVKLGMLLAHVVMSRLPPARDATNVSVIKACAQPSPRQLPPVMVRQPLSFVGASAIILNRISSRNES